MVYFCLPTPNSMVNFSVKNPNPSDVAAFKKFAGKLPANQAFSLLIKKLSESTENTEENQQLITGLQAKINELTEVNQRLTTVNQELTAQAHTAFETTQNQTLQIETLQAQVDAAAGKVDLSFPNFICKPTEKLAADLRKIRPFAIKKGFVKKADDDNGFMDYPNQISQYALLYLIVNEFRAVVN